MKQTRIIDAYCPGCDLRHGGLPMASIQDGHYLIFKCSACQLVFSYPRPTQSELETIYDDFEMTKFNKEVSSGIEDLYRGTVDFLVSHSPGTKAPKFLDYGFGAGEFLKQVSRMGFDAYGVEFDTRRCQELENFSQNGKAIRCLNVRESSIREYSGIDFDFITLFQVIEHVLKPQELIKELSQFQSPGKFLYMECPNNDALFLQIKNRVRKLTGRESFFDSLRPPIHINGFTVPSLRAMLERSGYAPVSIGDYRCADGVHQPENSFMYPSLGQLLSDKTQWNGDTFLRSCVRYFDRVGLAVGRGSGIYCLAKKQKTSGGRP